MRFESTGLAFMIFEPLFFMVQAGVIVNVGLAVFNIIPIPPLDGSNVLLGILPVKQAQVFAKISRYGFVILLILVLTGVIKHVIFPIIKVILMVLIG